MPKVIPYASVLASDIPLLKRVGKVSKPTIHSFASGGYVVSFQMKMGLTVLRSQREEIRVFKQFSTALKLVSELGFGAGNFDLNPLNMNPPVLRFAHLQPQPVQDFTSDDDFMDDLQKAHRDNLQPRSRLPIRDPQAIQNHNAEVARKNAAKAKRKKSKR